QDQLETLIEVDRQIGAIVAALGPRISNTLFVFTSDNGLAWGEHRQFNGKSCQYEECMRVPMVVRFDPLTGGTPSVDSVHPVLNIDLAPTAAEAAGLTDAPAIEGRSFLPVLSSPAPATMAFDSEPPPTSLTPVAFEFGGPGLWRFRCSVDGGRLAACASPFSPPGQMHGPHTLAVIGDGPGGTSAPLRWDWTISDRFPATPSFTSTPPARSGRD